MQILVDGEKVDVYTATVSFHEVLRIALGDADASREAIAITFVGAGPEGDASGALLRGESIRVREGIAFTVARAAAAPAKP